MARASRQKPLRLAEKLKTIRDSLGLSQSEMTRALAIDSSRSTISGFELGTKEPSLPTLLAYARLFGISTDLLIDDALDLPKTKASGSGRKSSR
jgi:transcriptional regulator with XRE-family HTH domain